MATNDTTRPFRGIAGLVEGERDIRRVTPKEQTRWIAGTVTANEDMSGVFSVPFPDNTLYWDQRTQSAHGMAGDAEQVMTSSLGSLGAASPSGDRGLWTRWSALGLANGVLLVVVAYLLVRRVRLRNPNP